MDPSLNDKCKELKASCRDLFILVAIFAGNLGLCWLVTALIGGNALASETEFEGPPTIEIDGERVVVHRAIFEFSFWHSVFTVLTAPGGILFFLSGLWQGFRLFRIRRIMRRGFEECPKVFS